MASDLATILKRVQYFAKIGGDHLAAVARATRARRYEREAWIITEGEPCEGLYFVIDGHVKVFKVSESGREQVLRILGPGRTFNDVPVFDGGPNPGNVSALERSTIGLIPKARLLSLVADQPGVAMAVIRVLATRLRAMTTMVEDLALRGVTSRIAKLLLECSRGQPPLAESDRDICVELTQERLAAMVGSVREVVHRALKALEQDGAIAIGRGRVHILQGSVLEAWSNPQRL